MYIISSLFKHEDLNGEAKFLEADPEKKNFQKGKERVKTNSQTQIKTCYSYFP